MDNREKKEWLLNEILAAGLNIEGGLSPTPDFITILCPWGGSYRLRNTADRLRLFSKQVSKCYGYKNRRRARVNS